MSLKHLTLALAGVAALAVLAGCTGAPAASAPATKPATQTTSAAGDPSAVLASMGFTGMSGEQIVEKIDQDSSARPLAMKASVRPDKVVLGNAQGEVVVPLKDKGFYLSIAPFARQTHECYFHSLATCKGEMVSTPVHVTIKDAAGAVLVDEDTTTYANGFVSFWLPRNIAGTVTVTADGRTGTVPFATGAEDATCLTTLQVK
ncbi:CueP family metal-binding protein [Propioniciclava coleopterorum]|uniref:CueP family metal-binding protein n=1 Tax=Propioniciclava coleopterorum TaxID=2714937 RepID=UPI00197E742E|nr:CueP family metal-binding protein [Propioniciclava coleopterorum]